MVAGPWTRQPAHAAPRIEVALTDHVPQIPGYRIIRPLGIGGMASVYLALQESLDREVALKVMAPALAANHEFTQRFLKEGRITAQLSHPNLVTVHDIGQSGTHYYLAAEYIPGGTLRERLAQGISIAESLDCVRDIAHGLHFAHEKGFVHRDVKPGNILFRADGSAVLADFGIAKSMGSGTMATQIGNSIGTPHYMSPEQARAESVDGRSDLYSLGAVLYECLVGKPPYDAADPFTIALMHVTHPMPQLPPPFTWLQPLVAGLMAKNADDRFPTGDAFAAAIDQLLATAPEASVLKEAPSPRKRATPRLATTSGQGRGVQGISGGKARAPAAPAGSRRRMWFTVGAVAGALLVAAGIWSLVGREPASPGVPPVTVVPAQPIEPASTEPASQGPVTDVSSVDVAGLLTQAREYVRMGITQNGRRLASPEGDCAVDLYRRVLMLEPGNTDAKAGLDQIADYFEQKAKAAFDRGYYSGSMVLAEQGLRADESSDSLKRLRDDSRKAAGL